MFSAFFDGIDKTTLLGIFSNMAALTISLQKLFDLLYIIRDLLK